jgi:hypothetical protein
MLTLAGLSGIGNRQRHTRSFAKNISSHSHPDNPDTRT